MPVDAIRPAYDLVLATDLDGTFLGGDDDARASLYGSIEAHRDQILLIFVTGRDLEFVTALGQQPGMPRPDLIIGDVGTTIVRGDDLTPVAPIQDWVDQRWAAANDRVLALLDGEPGLKLQPVMGARRVSYYYDPAVLSPSTLDKIERAGFDVVCSADTFLDVLPRGVAKGPTLTRLVAELGLDPDRVLVAGDTLNDLSLFHTGFKGVAVGNSEQPLLDAITGLPDVRHRPEHAGCAGISEAIEHFGFLARSGAPTT